jgi:hypothetical protein
MELSPSWNPPVAQLVKNFPTCYGTRSFITVFTRSRHWFLSWARSIQSIPPHCFSLRSVLILSSHLRLPSGLFPSCFATKIPYAFSFRHTCCIPYPPRSPWLDHSNYNLRRVQFMKLNIMQLSPTSYHFIPLRSKYYPQHPILKHLRFMFFPSCQETKFHTHTKLQAKL